MTNRSQRVAASAVLAAAAASGAATAPAAAAPRVAVTDVRHLSANHRFIVVSKRDADTTSVFSANSPDRLLWQAKGYSPLVDVSNDGRHVALLYAGGNILGPEAVAATPLVVLLSDGRPPLTVTLGSVVPHPEAISPSDSGRVWGYFVGFLRDGRFSLVRYDGRQFRLDPAAPSAAPAN